MPIPVQHVMMAKALCCTARLLFVLRLARLTHPGNTAAVKQPGLHMKDNTTSDQAALLLLQESLQCIS